MADMNIAARTWWRGHDEEARRLAYYRCMRQVYGMTASEALSATRRCFKLFAGNYDPLGVLRAALARAA